jgi:hypothetical protein
MAFFRFVAGWEDSHLNVIQATGMNLPVFLEENDLCTAVAYQQYRKAVREFGMALVEELGVPAVRLLGRVPTSHRRPVTRRLRMHVGTSGTQPSPQRATALIKEAFPAFKATPTRKNPEAKLRAEIGELKARVRELEAQVRELEAENTRLRFRTLLRR